MERLGLGTPVLDRIVILSRGTCHPNVNVCISLSGSVVSSQVLPHHSSMIRIATSPRTCWTSWWRPNRKCRPGWRAWPMSTSTRAAPADAPRGEARACPKLSALWPSSGHPVKPVGCVSGSLVGLVPETTVRPVPAPAAEASGAAAAAVTPEVTEETVDLAAAVVRIGFARP